MYFLKTISLLGLLLLGLILVSIFFVYIYLITFSFFYSIVVKRLFHSYIILDFPLFIFLNSLLCFSALVLFTLMLSLTFTLRPIYKLHLYYFIYFILCFIYFVSLISLYTPLFVFYIILLYYSIHVSCALQVFSCNIFFYLLPFTSFILNIIFILFYFIILFYTFV